MAPSLTFPAGFVFGGATAAYQCEGETHAHGKGEVSWDPFLAKKGRFSADPASDFYHCYERDLALCEQFGLNGIRVSIAWSRIFPQGTGPVNPEGVAFYHDVLRACRAHGVEPYVTLHHFDTPLALFEKGGFLNRDTIDAYEAYARFCFEEYRDEVRNWFTFNEIWAVASNTFIEGTFPPGGITCALDKALQCNHNMMLAHARAVNAFHEGGYEGKIGVVHTFEGKYPYDELDPADIRAAKNEDVLVGELAGTRLVLPDEQAYPGLAHRYEQIVRNSCDVSLARRYKDIDTFYLRISQGDCAGFSSGHNYRQFEGRAVFLPLRGMDTSYTVSAQWLKGADPRIVEVARDAARACAEFMQSWTDGVPKA